MLLRSAALVSTRVLSTLVVLASAVLLASAGHALTIYDIQLDQTMFGHLDQDDTSACGGQGQVACGPTAAVNSLVWLQNQYPDIYDNSLILGATEDLNGDEVIDEYDDWIATANALGGPDYMNCLPCQTGQPSGGTSISNFISGKQAWIEDHVPGMTTYADQNIHSQTNSMWPQWQFIYDNLVSGEDVELLVGFYDTNDTRIGGHYLTLTSFHFEDVDMDGVLDIEEVAWIDFIDPGTGQHTQADIVQAEQDGAIGSDYGVGGTIDGTEITLTRIESAVKESPIPEPGTALLVGGGLVLLGARARRRA